MNALPSVILVDDDEMIRRVCTRILAGKCSLAVFSSAEEFFTRAELKNCDIVFADINLPGISGLDLIRRLKAAAPHCDAVIITGEPTLDAALTALKAGAYDFLTKPFPAEQLLAVTDRCVEKRRLSAELAAVKAAQEELTAAYSQLQGAERMKEAFLSVIGHELRTPLTKILSGLSLLETSVPAAPPEITGIMKNGAEALHSVLEDLIAYAESSREPPPDECRATDLNEIVRLVCAGLSTRAAQAGVSISASYSTGGAVVPGSGAGITRAVRHLLLNAITFSSQGATVWIEVVSDSEKAAITVRDTGPGIPAELLTCLGNPFYQVADYLTRKSGGLGLGLAIAKRVAEAHRGSLTVTSAAGKGAVFALSFSHSDPCSASGRKGL
ncbi:MAG TPA: hypothetical protein DCZ93_05570 [Elusimicrobia bacterium]|nr:MAG: hypothetical protein A2X35_07155 [Elusimicrobia bacterium GWA2_61_42]OGR74990.1 MAG: hypothetical protein A2X38_01305 [Elusimicrobia bacterium GWC2_61_25]HBB66760.1 hypothetical protein [Elusimicrobiota bacterium]